MSERIPATFEARRYQELRLRQMAGEIVELECHPRFDLYALSPVGLDVDGDHIGRYTPDFRYITRDGEVRLRKRLFEANYYPLVVREL